MAWIPMTPALCPTEVLPSVMTICVALICRRSAEWVFTNRRKESPFSAAPADPTAFIALRPCSISSGAGRRCMLSLLSIALDAEAPGCAVPPGSQLKLAARPPAPPQITEHSAIIRRSCR